MMMTAMMATAQLKSVCVDSNEIREILGVLTADTKTDPLLLPRGTSAINGFADVLVARDEMRVRLLSLLLDILHQRLLLHDDRIQVLEQLLQLDHGALDLLDGIVALLHIAQSGLRLASTIRIEECLLEYLRIAAVHGGFPDLGLVGFGVDDQVLPALLLLHFFPELALLRLVRVDRLPYPAVQRVDLWLVHGLLRFSLALDSLHAVGQAAVAGHDVGAHGVDLLVCGAIAAHEAALHALEVCQAVLEVVDGATDCAALVEDGVRVAALGYGSGGLRVWSCRVKGLHFNVVILRCVKEFPSDLHSELEGQ